MREIGLEEFRSTVKKIVQEKGTDHVYEIPGGGITCLYLLEDGHPSCLIGHALMELGVSPATLSVFNSTGINALVTRGIVNLTYDAQLWAATVQGVQDKQRPWGEAVAEGDHRMGLADVGGVL